MREIRLVGRSDVNLVVPLTTNGLCEITTLHNTAGADI